jgi:hypothetical protein
MDVTFTFVPDDKVTTPFGEMGIVTMCAIDDNRKITYAVKGSSQTQWYKEGELQFTT